MCAGNVRLFDPAAHAIRAILDSRKNAAILCLLYLVALTTQLAEFLLKLGERADQSLVGCNIIFVGNEQNFEELKTLAFKAGAEFHATTYPKK